MSNWQNWIVMAQNSLEAGGRTKKSSPRSSASRYYYAAYQAMSALLLYAGKTPPEGREAWSHELTPVLVQNDLSTLVPEKYKRMNMGRRLDLLRKIRVSADYVSEDDVETHLEEVSKSAEFLVKIARDILLEGR